MHAEDAVVDYGGKRKIVKDISAVAPNIEGAVLPQALIVETIDLRNLAALVVSPNEGH